MVQAFKNRVEEVRMEKIMIIDSDIRQLREINDEISGRYQALNLSRGDKALDLFRLYQPTALVLDPTTPGFNGREFIRQVRDLPRGKNMPILALTRMTTLRHIEESFDLGVDMIFSKPCSGARVKKKLDECFERQLFDGILALS